MTIATRAFPCAAGAVAAARRFVCESIGGVPTSVLDRAALMVSELATNSVTHAQTSFEVSADRVGDTVRVVVTDTGTGVPAVQWPPTTEIHGRGLRIVSEMADDWGVLDHQVGKSVWFELRVSSSSF